MPTLAAYLKRTGQTHAGFGKRIGASKSAVGRIASFKKDASADLQRRIFAATNGEVTPNDLVLRPGSVTVSDVDAERAA